MILQRCAHPRPCYDDGKCHYKGECGHKAPLTNADRIRTMSDEELAEQFVFMSTICEFCVKRKKCEEVPGYKYCMEGILDWLQRPAEEDDKNGV